MDTVVDYSNVAVDCSNVAIDCSNVVIEVEPTVQEVNPTMNCCLPWKMSYKMVPEPPIVDPSENIFEPNEKVTQTEEVTQTEKNELDEGMDHKEGRDHKGTVGSLNWEDAFFKKFEWLNNEKSMSNSKSSQELSDSDSSLEEQNIKDASKDNGLSKTQLFEKMCGYLEQYLNKTDENNQVVKIVETDPTKMALNLYFVGLENNKLLLHASFTPLHISNADFVGGNECKDNVTTRITNAQRCKKSREQIILDCEKLYEYAKVNKPQNVVFVLENIDLFDVDKYVKMFMHMFGQDDCRGGSYLDVILPDYVQQTLKQEFEIVGSIDYYVQREKLLETSNA